MGEQYRSDIHTNAPSASLKQVFITVSWIYSIMQILDIKDFRIGGQTDIPYSTVGSRVRG